MAVRVKKFQFDLADLAADNPEYPEGKPGYFDLSEQGDEGVLTNYVPFQVDADPSTGVVWVWAYTSVQP